MFSIIHIIFIAIIIRVLFIKLSKNNRENEKIKNNIPDDKKPIIETVFLINNTPIYLDDIENDFYNFFYDNGGEDKIYQLAEVNSSEDVILYYSNQNKQIQFSKGRNNNIENIRIFYKNGVLMYEFNLIDHIKIELKKYTNSNELIYVKDFYIDMLGILLNKYDIDEYFYYTIVLLYRVLEITNLSKFIEQNNIHPQSIRNEEKIKKEKNELIEDISSLLNEIGCKKDCQNIKKLDHSDGPFRTYFENQSLKSIGSYKNNHFHGRYVGYHLNGRIKEEGDYNEGIKINKWRYYNEKGSIINEEIFWIKYILHKNICKNFISWDVTFSLRGLIRELLKRNRNYIWFYWYNYFYNKSQDYSLF